MKNHHNYFDSINSNNPLRQKRHFQLIFIIRERKIDWLLRKRVLVLITKLRKMVSSSFTVNIESKFKDMFSLFTLINSKD